MLDYELGNRALDALIAENSGNRYQRVNTIRERWLDGLVRKADYYEGITKSGS